MSHTYTNLLTRVIFSTKDRAPLITAPLHDDLLAYLGGIVREIGGAQQSCAFLLPNWHLFNGGTLKSQNCVLRQPADIERMPAPVAVDVFSFGTARHSGTTSTRTMIV